MADLKIYNNGENKILFSAGDRIIRQPYEFTKGFIGICEIDYEMGNTDFTIFRNQWRVSDGPCPNLFYLNNTVNITASFLNTVNYRLSVTNFGSQITVGDFYNIYNRPNPVGVIYDNTTGVCQVFGKGLIEDLPTPYILNNDSTKITTYGSLTHYISEFTVFTRKLSSSEITFLYSNGLWGGIQLTNALSINLLMDKAEILNTGGSDFVGVRDYSGNNRHGRIMNLPAGTLQEQLDWANANLFVPFIS